MITDEINRNGKIDNEKIILKHKIDGTKSKYSDKRNNKKKRAREKYDSHSGV